MIPLSCKKELTNREFYVIFIVAQIYEGCVGITDNTSFWTLTSEEKEGSK